MAEEKKVEKNAVEKKADAHAKKAAEAKAVEAPKKAETPKVEAKKSEASKMDVHKAEAHKAETKKPELKVVKEKKETRPDKEIIISLKGLNWAPMNKRSNKAIRRIREQIARHAKIPIENANMAREINETVWKGRLKDFPRKLELVYRYTENRAFLKNGKEWEELQKMKQEAEKEKAKQKKEEKKAEPEKAAESAEEKEEEKAAKKEKKLEKRLQSKESAREFKPLERDEA
ncbi:MAG: hypothetical protein V1847_00240 [Candidatus Diapherotrites archaeon]